ncbi:MAG: hypothetical protein U0228_07675 [Myxococcaceae bacterium]
MFRSLLAASSLVLCACGPLSRVNQCSPSAQGQPKQAVLIAKAGEPIDIDVVLPPAVFCQNGNPVAVGVTTLVVDSDNVEWPHMHSDPISSDTKGYSTTVSFTPPHSGAYHLEARFEPALGIGRRQLQVFQDRSAETPALRMPSSAPCDEVAGLSNTVLCRRGAALTVLDADGGTVATATVDGMAVSQGTAWWWTSSDVTRLREVNSALERTTIAATVPPGPIHASATRLTRGTTSLLQVSNADDGGLETSTRDLPFAATGPGLCRGGPHVGFATATALCATQDDADASVTCVEVIGLVPGAGQGDLLWVRGKETGVVGRARVSPDGGEPVLLFLDAQPPTLVDLKTPLPSFTWNGQLLSVSPTLTFDAWSPPARTVRQSVTPEYVVFQTTTELWLFRR